MVSFHLLILFHLDLANNENTCSCHECYPPANEKFVEWYIFMQVRATQKTIYTVLTIRGSCFKIYRNTPPE